MGPFHCGLLVNTGNWTSDLSSSLDSSLCHQLCDIFLRLLICFCWCHLIILSPPVAWAMHVVFAWQIILNWFTISTSPFLLLCFPIPCNYAKSLGNSFLSQSVCLGYACSICSANYSWLIHYQYITLLSLCALHMLVIIRSHLGIYLNMFPVLYYSFTWKSDAQGGCGSCGNGRIETHWISQGADAAAKYELWVTLHCSLTERGIHTVPLSVYCYCSFFCFSLIGNSCSGIRCDFTSCKYREPIFDYFHNRHASSKLKEKLWVPKKHKIQYSGCYVQLIWACYIVLALRVLFFLFVDGVSWSALRCWIYVGSWDWPLTNKL